MKNILLILFMALSATGYASTPKKNAMTVCHEVIQTGKFPKASVIFWIDLDKSKSNMGKTIRNVKAKVSINKEGKINVLEYEKKQPSLITNKIDKCLKTFRVKPEWIGSGKVKTGENIVFLRFLDEY